MKYYKDAGQVVIHKYAVSIFLRNQIYALLEMQLTKIIKKIETDFYLHFSSGLRTYKRYKGCKNVLKALRRYKDMERNEFDFSLNI